MHTAEPFLTAVSRDDSARRKNESGHEVFGFVPYSDRCCFCLSNKAFSIRHEKKAFTAFGPGGSSSLAAVVLLAKAAAFTTGERGRQKLLVSWLKPKEEADFDSTQTEVNKGCSKQA